MRTTVGVAEARAQLSEIISHAVNDGTVTVIERYGKPAVAVVPFADLPPEVEPEDTVVGTPTTARERHAKLMEALNGLLRLAAQ